MFVTAGLLLLGALGLSLNVSAAPPATEVGGGINVDTTWTVAGSPYIVIANILVSPSATLTIQPGVEVRFNPDARLRIEGTLFAQGTPANPIRFTANNPSGTLGRWAGIFFKDSGTALTHDELVESGLGNYLQYCIVELAGSEQGAIRIEDSAVFVDHCTVRNNSNAGIRVISNPEFAVTISNNVVEHNQFSGDGAGIFGIESTITGNLVRYNYATGDGAGIYAVSNSLVQENLVGYNTSVDDGGGMYAANSSVGDNFIYNNNGDEAGGIYSLNNTLTGNTIVRNHSGRVAAGLYFIGSTPFQQNTVVANTSTPGFAYGGVVLSGTPTVSFNNFYSNSPFDLVVQSSTNIAGENNYWGTADSGTILGRIFDAFDDPNRGLFDFSPFLVDATFPVPPPLNLQAEFSGSTAELSWSPLPSTSEDYVYKVYYSTTNSAPPYNGTGLPQGSSPIEVGSATSFTLTGLTGRVLIVVTAEDSSNQESWYSNQVDNLARVYLPIINQ
ncbi:MAG TPA: right-handed parallel beta-helix repeat-containing protein [Anaerolineales bacterium]|nr:right-handed parallel beta-helix repeat-containing protein [Anaerolineales bacterium]